LKDYMITLFARDIRGSMRPISDDTIDTIIELLEKNDEEMKNL